MSATVVLYDSGKIIAYAITDNQGNFSIKLSTKVPSTGYLEISHIQYQKQQWSLNKFASGDVIQIVLTPSSKLLDSLTIKSLIYKIQDTITFPLDSGLVKDHDKIEDVIRKIPGMEIDRQGKIKYQDKTITNLLINGSDLVGSDYQAITKNINANLFKNIQILTNYNDNRIIGSLFESGDHAINLNTKDEQEGKISGSGNIGGAPISKYLVGINMLYTAGKVTAYTLGQFNNIYSSENATNNFSRNQFNSISRHAHQSYIPQMEYRMPGNMNDLSNTYGINNKFERLFPTISTVLSNSLRLKWRASTSRFTSNGEKTTNERTTINSMNTFEFYKSIAQSGKKSNYGGELSLQYDNSRSLIIDILIGLVKYRNNHHISGFQETNWIDKDSIASTNTSEPLDQYGFATITHKVNKKSAVQFEAGIQATDNNTSLQSTSALYSNFINIAGYNDLQQRSTESFLMHAQQLSYISRLNKGSFKLYALNEHARQYFNGNNLFYNPATYQKHYFSNTFSITTSNLLQAGVLMNATGKNSRSITTKFATGIMNLSMKHHWNYLAQVNLNGKMAYYAFYTISLKAQNKIPRMNMLLGDSLFTHTNSIKQTLPFIKPEQEQVIAFNFKNEYWYNLNFNAELAHRKNIFSNDYYFSPVVSMVRYGFLASSKNFTTAVSASKYIKFMYGSIKSSYHYTWLNGNTGINNVPVYQTLNTHIINLGYVSDYKGKYSVELQTLLFLNSFRQLNIATPSKNQYLKYRAIQRLDFSNRFYIGCFYEYSQYANGNFHQLDIYSTWKLNSRFALNLKGINLLNQKGQNFSVLSPNIYYKTSYAVTKPYILATLDFNF